MKKFIFVLCFYSFLLPSILGQLVLWDDFESYNQGPISNQNPGWINNSNASVDVTWNGNDFLGCTDLDQNNSYLRYVSADNVSNAVLVTTSNQQYIIDLKVRHFNGFHLTLNGDDNTFFQYSNSFSEVNNAYKLFIDFYNNEVKLFINDIQLSTSPIPAFVNQLNAVTFSNQNGNFGLGCITITDVTDLDNDGYSIFTDCDDTNANINPGRPEIPYNGLDDDCNPATRENDLDMDGFDVPADCDDANANINPGRPEIPYNGIDDDCNPDTRENDLDLDGFDVPSDCNDADANINPSRVEVPYNGIDDDCNPATRENDLDLDGYDFPTDCDDNNSGINPGQIEILDNDIDENCDGIIGKTSSISELLNENINIRPNPTTGYFTINSAIVFTRICILDGLGNIVSTLQGNNYDISHLCSGVYFVKMYDQHGKFAFVKLIKI